MNLDLPLILKALFLGILEGLTEFIPVSSTGHLIVAAYLIEFSEIPEQVFEIAIQFGAILAICFVYQRRLLKVVFNLGSKVEQNFVLNLLIGVLPAVVLGLLFHDFIKEVLFNVAVIAYALIIGGIILIIFDRLKLSNKVADLDQLSKLTAFKIGFCQCIAMIPGVSRAGATIVGGVAFGLTKRSASEFSFFLAIPTILGAALLDLYKNFEHLNMQHFFIILLGFIAAFFAAWLVVRQFISLVERYGFAPFGYYRIALGIVILLII